MTTNRKFLSSCNLYTERKRR